MRRGCLSTSGTASAHAGIKIRARDIDTLTISKGPKKLHTELVAMARIYGKNVAIDSRQVNQFFENRFCKENPLASAHAPTGSGRRYRRQSQYNENALVHGFLKNRTSDTKLRVLTWAAAGTLIQNLNGCINSYVAVDFAETISQLPGKFTQRKRNVPFSIVP